MDLIRETKYIMNKFNIKADKNLGQNFLIDENIVNKIIDSSSITKEDLVIEIGPGLGTLTSKLLEKSGKVICIELDSKMISVLNSRFSLYKNFELINDDVLKVNLKEIIEKNLNGNIKYAKVVANLPYYITTPIIMKLLEDKLNLHSIIVMVQKEVALRLAATPGEKDSGAITYAIHYYTNPKIITNVPNTSFIPSPKVASAVIKFQVLDKPSVKVDNEALFFNIIKSAFLQKRKTLINCLVNNNIFTNKLDAEKMLLDLNLDLKIRGEKLSLNDFVKITEYIEKNQ
ncbi:MAG: 16S rRNA (adenine(1518)-N(6)/adenine(1519)-N(6))-dimethyltransferase RsmA [Candidatus Scatovivens sp.]